MKIAHAGHDVRRLFLGERPISGVDGPVLAGGVDQTVVKADVEIVLAERLGGPSVKPYQPEGLWRELAEIKDYPQDHGPDLYRRGLYTFWKRTVAPPSLAAFDASGRFRTGAMRPEHL